MSFPGNATRRRHGYQDDRSFLPLGLKQEHFVSQDPLIFWNFTAIIEVFLFWLMKTCILSISLVPGKYFLYQFFNCIIVVSFLLDTCKNNKHCILGNSEKVNTSIFRTPLRFDLWEIFDLML